MLQEGERYSELADAVFAWVKRPGHSAVVSTIVLTELLVPLYAESPGGDFLLTKLTSVDDKKNKPDLLLVLATYPNLEWIAADFGIADLAARYRARYGLKTPDALHAATAVRSEATAFVTNDKVFDRVQEFKTLQFEKLV